MNTINDAVKDKVISYLQERLSDVMPNSLENNMGDVTLQNDEIIAEPITTAATETGITEYVNNMHSFKCYLKSDQKQIILVKYHEDYHFLLRDEFVGIKAFSRYFPRLVPNLVMFDQDNNILVQEYLRTYKPIQNLFISGDLDIDAATFIGSKISYYNLQNFDLINKFEIIRTNLNRNSYGP